MSISLRSVKNAKDPDDEFVWLRATANTSLEGYAIVDRTFDDSEEVSNEFRHIFFFPDLEVEKDDWIVLCTGNSKGKDKKKYKKLIKDDSVFHSFFWGSKECVWNDNGDDSASLIKYSSIKSVRVPAVEK
ncbi:hypothetical protein BC749_108177 [Flavobacterium araucananum]|uniref:hypothetical protein n=1 Tax=Flavobacterium araucananum TaxID=946678 RepID=UPI000D7B0697|nr:hypothetical protein [Flavobacterium araucananum]PWJ97027.1 hypothetical protein BC749_108177 [Flavobacterium araucananum]